MIRTRILSTGFRVPDRVVTNHELEGIMETSDEWIRKRSGIEERRWAAEDETGADLAEAASRMALERAGLEPEDLDALILATLSPDHFFPGTGVFVQRQLGVTDIPCLDVRNQCSGFLYGLSVADAWIRAGVYERVLLIGAELHSAGLDLSLRGRDTAVLFGDGAGAAVLEASDDDRGVLAVRIHADGRHAETLWTDMPGCAHRPFVTCEDIEEKRCVPEMQGREVFRHAIKRMPEAVFEVLEESGHGLDELAMVIPHQANLRIAQGVQKTLGLPDQKVYNNIQRYGNTTAASIPIALHEAVEEGRIADGDLVCLTAFGSGFTWGGALLRW
ncbi:MAG TPA: beta-ketoacyl-ACP synthase III [Gemmatimonadota bacterium]|nr:beta-ketoacyl-ACP synthase III [Gemmatimonadota bacterium]